MKKVFHQYYKEAEKMTGLSVDYGAHLSSNPILFGIATIEMLNDMARKIEELKQSSLKSNDFKIKIP